MPRTTLSHLKTHLHYRSVLLALLLLTAILIVGSTLLPTQASNSLPPTGGNLSASTSISFPVFQNNNNGFYSTLYLRNLGAAQANVDVNISNLLGSTISENRTIPLSGTLVFGEADLTSQLSGSLVGSANQPITGTVIQENQGTATGDAITIIPPATDGATELSFGPLGTTGTWGFVVQNVSASPANLSVEYINLDGTTAGSPTNPTLPAGASRTFTSFFDAPTSTFEGWVRITSDQPVDGYATVIDNSLINNNITSSIPVLPAVGPGASTVAVPRVTDQTTLFLGNQSSSTANVSIDYYDAAGNTTPQSVTLSPNSGLILGADGSTAFATTSGFTGSALIQTDQPLFAAAYTRNADSTGLRSNADTYIAGPDTTLVAPYVTITDTTHTAMNIQNVSGSPTDATIFYYDTSGTNVTSSTTTIPPGAAARIDQSMEPGLSNTFVGSAEITTSGGDIVVAVDVIVEGATVPATSTPTSTPTNTPTNTPTATPGSGGAPTATPTNTPGSGGAPTATPTATPGSGGAPTATPTSTPDPIGTPTATPDPGGAPTTTPTEAPSPVDVNFMTGAPGSIFVFTTSGLPAGAQAQIAVQEPGATSFTSLATYTVPDDGVLAFVLETPADAPAGTYIIQITVDPQQAGAAQAIVRELSITLAADAPLRTDRPADIPGIPLDLTQRLFLPLISR
jgi:hypothetical protein